MALPFQKLTNKMDKPMFTVDADGHSSNKMTEYMMRIGHHGPNSQPQSYSSQQPHGSGHSNSYVPSASHTQTYTQSYGQPTHNQPTHNQPTAQMYNHPTTYSNQQPLRSTVSFGPNDPNAMPYSTMPHTQSTTMPHTQGYGSTSVNANAPFVSRSYNSSGTLQPSPLGTLPPSNLQAVSTMPPAHTHAHTQQPHAHGQHTHSQPHAHGTQMAAQTYSQQTYGHPNQHMTARNSMSTPTAARVSLSTQPNVKGYHADYQGIEDDARSGSTGVPPIVSRHDSPAGKKKKSKTHKHGKKGGCCACGCCA